MEPSGKDREVSPVPPTLLSSVSAVHAEVGDLLAPRALEVRPGWTCQSCLAQGVRRTWWELGV